MKMETNEYLLKRIEILEDFIGNICTDLINYDRSFLASVEESQSLYYKNLHKLENKRGTDET